MKKKGIVKGFIEFISKGNIIDLAVAVIMGAAFGAIVNSLVKDIINPMIAAIFGAQGDFANLHFVLNGTEIFYGRFINAVVSFFIIALFIYIFIILIVKGSQKRLEERRKQEAQEAPKPAPIPEDVKLLQEIKEELVKLNKEKNNK